MTDRCAHMCAYGMNRCACEHACGVKSHACVCACGVNSRARVHTCGVKQPCFVGKYDEWETYLLEIFNVFMFEMDDQELNYVIAGDHFG
jgi:hypothetical protein